MRQLPSLERMQVLRLTAHVDSCAVLANLHVALQSDQVGLRSRELALSTCGALHWACESRSA
jgi:hypothetical protein